MKIKFNLIFKNYFLVKIQFILQINKKLPVL